MGGRDGVFKPKKFFAFGFDPDVEIDLSDFQVVERSDSGKNETLEVVNCPDSHYFDLEAMEAKIGKRRFPSLYCLKNYDTYALKKSVSLDNNTSVLIVFETTDVDKYADERF